MDKHAPNAEVLPREPEEIPADPARPQSKPRPSRERGRPRRLGKAVVLVPLLIGLGLVLWWWHPWSHPQRGPRPEPPQAIGEAQVTRGDLPIVLSGLGTVTPLAMVTLQSQISGVLTDVGFKEGQLVKKGDFLAQIDPRPYQAALEQAQGTLAHDQGLLKQAQVDLVRYQTLNKQDSIAKQQVDDQVYLVRQYEGTVVSDQAAVDTQKLNLTYCHMTSPVDGRVGLRLIDPGNYIQASSSTGLVVITQLQPISVIFTLPEDDIARIQKRLRTGATLPVVAWDRSNTTQLATGTLETIDNVVDVTTGTVKLRATFPNDDDALFANQFVNAGLLVDTLKGATLVANAAVQNGAPGSYVYLVNSNDTVSVRPVKIGPTDGTHTAILSGLEPGDDVVVDGADRLRDGSKVMVPKSAGPEAAQSGNPGTGSGSAQQGEQQHHRRQPANGTE